jgi:hypothetical protein
MFSLFCISGDFSKRLLNKYTKSSPRQVSKSGLPDELNGELNFARGCCRRRQQTCHACGSSVRIEYIRVVGRHGHSKVCTIQNIEKLSPELNVEILGDFPNWIVLENRKIKRSEARPN